ncbi:M12 family metallo-peptidase [Marinobacterium aestuariivivens]|uniref:M12 family metallo-peptidase n=1 Tax=Marinobacterium aestuariivivens TaxID=1698799 RepID=UPI0036D3648E
MVFAPDNVRLLQLDFLSQHTETEFHELSFHGYTEPEKTTPTFEIYESKNRSKSSGHVIIEIEDRATTALVADVSFNDERREVLSAEKNMNFEQILLPDGREPDPSSILVILPPTSSSPASPSQSLTIEDPSNPRNMAIFGTIYWCQLHPDNWRALIAETAFEIRAAFRKKLDVQGNGTTDTGWDIVLAKSWCMFYDASDYSDFAVDEAKFCEWGLRPSSGGNSCEANICGDAQGMEYPLTGCYRQSECFVNKVWDAVEYADHYLDLPNLELAMAQTWGSLQSADNNAVVPSCPDDTVPENVPIVCGLAKAPAAVSGDLAGASVTPGRPYSLWPPTEPTLDACAGPFIWSHETGHNFGAFHTGDFMLAPNNNPSCDQYNTLMTNQTGGPPGTCEVNAFSVDMRNHMVNTCSPANCPRTTPYVDQH